MVVPPQGQGLDLSVAFTQVHLTLTPPGSASECVPMNFFSLHQVRLKAVKRTSIFKHGYLHLHQQDEAKGFPLSLFDHMNEPLRFF